MSDPSLFIRACLDGRVWLFCRECGESRNFQEVEHLHTIENPSYWGTEPWWHVITSYSIHYTKLYDRKG